MARLSRRGSGAGQVSFPAGPYMGLMSLAVRSYLA
jgi:hypothetical protein